LRGWQLLRRQTRKILEERLAEHNAGLYGGYTATRRLVAMVYVQHFETITDAVSAERQIKGWLRAKKEAMIGGKWDRLPELAKRRNRSVRHEEPI